MICSAVKVVPLPENVVVQVSGVACGAGAEDGAWAVVAAVRDGDGAFDNDVAGLDDCDDEHPATAAPMTTVAATSSMARPLVMDTGNPSWGDGDKSERRLAHVKWGLQGCLAN
jgi:hypothetical protein